MGNKRKNYSSEFKFKVALAAMQGNKTIAQLCNEHQLAPSDIHRWKAVLQDMGPKLFNVNEKTLDLIAAHEAEIAKLYQQIGQLTVEYDFLKKMLNNEIRSKKC